MVDKTGRVSDYPFVLTLWRQKTYSDVSVVGRMFVGVVFADVS